MRKWNLAVVVSLLVLGSMIMGCDAFDPPELSLEGSWEGWVEIDFGSGPTIERFRLIFAATTYQALFVDAAGETILNGSTKGSYTFVGGVLRTTRAELYASDAWTSSPDTERGAGAVLTEWTLNYAFDMDGDGAIDYAWTLSRID